MQIVGFDFHPSVQQVSILDVSTGEVLELKLLHATGEAERFYRELEPPVLIGMESTESWPLFGAASMAGGTDITPPKMIRRELA